jgi:hypothetical protein
MQQQEEKEIIRPTNNNITNREMMMLLLHTLHHQALISMQVSHMQVILDAKIVISVFQCPYANTNLERSSNFHYSTKLLLP